MLPGRPGSGVARSTDRPARPWRRPPRQPPVQRHGRPGGDHAPLPPPARRRRPCRLPQSLPAATVRCRCSLPLSLSLSLAPVAAAGV